MYLWCRWSVCADGELLSLSRAIIKSSSVFHTVELSWVNVEWIQVSARSDVYTQWCGDLNAKFKSINSVPILSRSWSDTLSCLLLFIILSTSCCKVSNWELILFGEECSHSLKTQRSRPFGSIDFVVPLVKKAFNLSCFRVREEERS